MALNSLEVAGYRSLRQAELHFQALTVVTGPNGSGKTNIYRALQLAHACAVGDVARRIAGEGGMPSVVWAGRQRGEPKVELAVELDELRYEVDLATISRGSPDTPVAFPLDPVVTKERILAPGAPRRRVELLDRVGTTAFVRDDEGRRVVLPAAFRESESVLSQLVDPRQYPELALVRRALRSMRFHHQLRTDDDAPARRPSLGTRTLAVADDGFDLASALATIASRGTRRPSTIAWPRPSAAPACWSLRTMPGGSTSGSRPVMACPARFGRRSSPTGSCDSSSWRLPSSRRRPPA